MWHCGLGVYTQVGDTFLNVVWVKIGLKYRLNDDSPPNSLCFWRVYHKYAGTYNILS